MASRLARVARNDSRLILLPSELWNEVCQVKIRKKIIIMYTSYAVFTAQVSFITRLINRKK